MSDEDLVFAALVRKRPAMYLGNEGAEILVRMIALDAGRSFAGVVSVTLHDGSIAIRFTGHDGAAEYWKILQNAPSPPALTGESRAWSWALTRVCSTQAEAQERDDGFELAFTPDYAGIRGMTRVSAHRLAGWLADLATTRPGLRVEVTDDASAFGFATSFPRGAHDRLLAEGAGRRLNHAPLVFRGEHEGVSFDASFVWADGPGLQVVALVNGERTPAGGAHVRGIWEGMADGLNAELVRRSLADEPLVGALDVPRNCLLVVSVEMSEPKWGPATKDCLHSREALRALRTALASGLVEQLGPDIIESAEAPWQLLGAMHHQDGTWLSRLAEAVPKLKPGERWGSTDPYFHHE